MIFYFQYSPSYRYFGIILTLNLEVIIVKIIIKSSTLNTVFEKFKTELTKSLFYQHILYKGTIVGTLPIITL